jgi:hypothetical protein
MLITVLPGCCTRKYVFKDTHTLLHPDIRTQTIQVTRPLHSVHERYESKAKFCEKAEFTRGK